MTRQFLLFLIVGGIQYILDATAFSVLILFLTPEVSNVIARFLGAISGYFLNGIFTFKKLDQQQKIAPKILIKFIFLWCLMTLISTFMIQSAVGLINDEGWHVLVIVKLIVEALLVILSFSLQKFVVYR